MTNARGETVKLYIKTDFVNDEYSDVERMIMFRRRETEDTDAPNR